MRIAVTTLVLVLSFLAARSAFAQEEADASAPDSSSATAPAPTPAPVPTPVAAPPPSPPPPAAPIPADTTPLQPFPPLDVASDADALKVTPTGYIETYYAWNFNRPVNNITNYRGFDNRHNTFTLETVALGANFEKGPVGGRLMLQIGSGPTTYYNVVESTQAGTPAANTSGPELWKYIQEAFITYKAPIGRGLTFNVGVAASPIGMDTFSVHEHWTWSRSNLFFGLPYYHTGIRATYALSENLSATVAVLNGWNNIVDNNDGKSVEAHVRYEVPKKGMVQLLYFGGVERPSSAPEGQYWRHHFDAVGEYDVTDWLQLAGQADAGFEPNRIGTARWYAGAAAARAKICKCLYFVVRGDRFYEHQATDSTGRSSTPLFWNGVEWVSSFTATLDFRPHDNISIRAEFRHDQADGLLYFTGDTLTGDGSARSPFLPNARRQQTMLLGATAWF